jgi:hypothetical protein
MVTTTGTAGAATRIPDSEWVSGGFQFVIKGKIANAPGNAHSGGVGQATNDGDYAGLYDWKCPAGVTPPSVVVDSAPTTCTLLRAAVVYEGGPYSIYPVVDWRMRTLRAAGTHSEVTDEKGEPQEVTVRSNYTMHGSGAVSTEVFTSGGIRQVIKTRGVEKVTGRFGWINFNDPRTRISGGTFRGNWFFPL